MTLYRVDVKSMAPTYDSFTVDAVDLDDAEAQGIERAREFDDTYTLIEVEGIIEL